MARGVKDGKTREKQKKKKKKKMDRQNSVHIWKKKKKKRKARKMECRGIHGGNLRQVVGVPAKEVIRLERKNQKSV